jgi:hypothetical protein
MVFARIMRARTAILRRPQGRTATAPARRNGTVKPAENTPAQANPTVQPAANALSCRRATSQRPAASITIENRQVQSGVRVLEKPFRTAPTQRECTKVAPRADHQRCGQASDAARRRARPARATAHCGRPGYRPTKARSHPCVPSSIRRLPPCGSRAEHALELGVMCHPEAIMPVAQRPMTALQNACVRAASRWPSARQAATPPVGYREALTEPMPRFSPLDRRAPGHPRHLGLKSQRAQVSLFGKRGENVRHPRQTPLAFRPAHSPTRRRHDWRGLRCGSPPSNSIASQGSMTARGGRQARYSPTERSCSRRHRSPFAQTRT